MAISGAESAVYDCLVVVVRKKVKVAHTRFPTAWGSGADLGSQPAGDVNHKPGGRLPLLFARSSVTLATLKRAATNVAAW